MQRKWAGGGAARHAWNGLAGVWWDREGQGCDDRGSLQRRRRAALPGRAIADERGGPWGGRTERRQPLPARPGLDRAPLALAGSVNRCCGRSERTGNGTRSRCGCRNDAELTTARPGASSTAPESSASREPAPFPDRVCFSPATTLATAEATWLNAESLTLSARSMSNFARPARKHASYPNFEDV